MKKLSYNNLHLNLNYDPLTGIFTRKKANTNCVDLGDIAGTKKTDGYIEIWVENERYLAHILAWFYVHGYWSENMIDHIDGVKHHNWIGNLREVSNQCNQRNRGNPKNNSSGVKGVSRNASNGNWMSYLYIKGKIKRLGSYKEFDNAVCARLAGEQCVGWEGCDSNSPAFLYVKEKICSSGRTGE